MRDLHFMSAVELARLVRRKVVGCVELLEHFIDRIEARDGAVNAVVVRDFERARARAREADAAIARGEVWGPVHGVPMTVKESFDVAGLPTTWGHPARAGRMADTDAVAVRRLKASGATVFGKTNVPVDLADWQSFNPVYGTTSNPWDPARTPGGSSGGAAAALAAGLTALEIGSDNGGSIRNPAHFCGVFGHKPTWGIVPTLGHSIDGEIAAQDINCIGPLARAADDLEIALDAIAGPTDPDSMGWTLALPRSRGERWADFTVGVMLSHPDCVQDDAVTENLQATVDELARLGVRVVDRGPDLDLAEQHRLYLALLLSTMGPGMSDEAFAAAAARAAGADRADRRYRTAEDRASTMSHRDWLAACEQRDRLRRRWAAYFREVDLLLCPVGPSAAFPHDHEGEAVDRTVPVNGARRPVLDQLFWAGLPGVAYLPACAAPTGLTRTGLPVGLQIVGGHMEDRSCIHFARLMERELGGFQVPPGFG